MREYPNLIGKRFGKLVVKELLPSDGSGHRKWLCECDCGNTYTACTGYLNNGSTTHCGCVTSPDISGKRFGKITVIRRTENRRKVGKRMITEWECRCDCGNIVYRTIEQLNNAKVRMCSTCSQQNNVQQAFKNAGFVRGTQVTKIKDRTLIKTNTSGCRGVYWHKKNKKWEARLKFKGKLLYLGSYSNFEDAVEARQRGEKEYFDAFLEQLNQEEKPPNK